MTARELVARIGQVTARRVLDDGLAFDWPGLDPLATVHSGRSTVAGIEPGTAAWGDAESVVEEAYREVMADW
jgi:hypothetical protein